MSDPVPAPVDPAAVPSRVRPDRIAAVLYPLASFGRLLPRSQFGVRAAGVREYILPAPS
ncbi:MAG: hypothetical protein ABI533_09635 [Betaproteobacteria bacterium]